MTGPAPDGSSTERDPAPVPDARATVDPAPGLPAPGGPPAGGIFTLEGRRAPGLYLLAWVFTIGGLAVMLVLGPMASDGRFGVILIGAGALAVTLGLAAGAGSQVLERAERAADRYRGPAPLLVFATYFMAMSALGLVVITGLGVDPDHPGGFFVNAALQTIGYAAVVWLFAVRTGALSWAQMGWPTWHGRDWSTSLGGVVRGAVTMVPVTFAIVLLGGLAGLLLGVDAPRQFPLSETALDGFFIAASAAVIVPLGEEVFFRGFVLTAWLRDLGERAALIRTSIFFALLHLAPIFSSDFSTGLRQGILVVAVILPVAFVFGRIFLRHGLIAAIAAHITYNSLLLLLAFLASKLPEPGAPGWPAV